MTNEFHHVTVLLHETVDMLDIKPDGIYVDATLGGAGHSSYLLSQLSEKGHLYCFDQDQKAIDNAQVRLKDYIDKGMVTFIKDNFRNLKSNLEALGCLKLMAFSMTWASLAHSWMSVSVVSPINRMLS